MTHHRSRSHRCLPAGCAVLPCHPTGRRAPCPTLRRRPATSPRDRLDRRRSGHRRSGHRRRGHRCSGHRRRRRRSGSHRRRARRGDPAEHLPRRRPRPDPDRRSSPSRHRPTRLPRRRAGHPRPLRRARRGRPTLRPAHLHVARAWSESDVAPPGRCTPARRRRRCARPTSQLVRLHGPTGPADIGCRPAPHQKSTFTSASAPAFASSAAPSTGTPMPSLALILSSISTASSGLSRRKDRAFSLP